MYAPLRILVLTDWFPETSGATAGIFVRQQALAVARRHDVSILHLQPPLRGQGRLRIEERSDGPLRVMRVRCGRPAVFTAVNLWAVAAALRRLGRISRTPDLLHAHEMAGGLAAVIAGRFLHRPVVLSEHSSGFAMDEVHGITARVARFAFAGADVVCPVSESLRASLECGGWGGHLRVIPNIIDTQQFTVKPPPGADEPPLIVAIGSLEPVKGVQDLVEALGVLRSRRTDFRVALVGEGPLRDELIRRADDLGLGEHLVMCGALLNPDVAGLMQRAAFAVIPSRWETFSVVMGEAMASGLPVVATAVGGMTERVHAGNGLLCKPRDPEGLAAALDAMLTNYRTYDPEAIAAEVRDRFSPARVADRWEEIYAEAIERRRRRRQRDRSRQSRGHAGRRC
jgi:glycosyltransferase involved in cell wall biosynthesis